MSCGTQQFHISLEFMFPLGFLSVPFPPHTKTLKTRKRKKVDGASFSKYSPKSKNK